MTPGLNANGRTRSTAEAVDPLHTQSTVLLLRATSVEVVLVQTGQILHSLSTANLQEQVFAQSAVLTAAASDSVSPSKAGMGRQGHIPLITAMVRSSSISGKEVRALEGKPTALHWCGITHLILVGFTTGGVGLLGLSGAIHSTIERVPQAHLQSNTQHGAEITKIITFNHRLQHRSAPHVQLPVKDIVATLIGDANGVLSIWQIYPAV